MYSTCPRQRLVNLVNRLLNEEPLVGIWVRSWSNIPPVSGSVTRHFTVALALPEVGSRCESTYSVRRVVTEMPCVPMKVKRNTVCHFKSKYRAIEISYSQISQKTNLPVFRQKNLCQPHRICANMCNTNCYIQMKNCTTCGSVCRCD